MQYSPFSDFCCYILHLNYIKQVQKSEFIIFKESALPLYKASGLTANYIRACEAHKVALLKSLNLLLQASLHCVTGSRRDILKPGCKGRM